MQVVDEARGRAVVVEKEGFPDAVVWNPWVEKAAGMGDFGDDEYKVHPFDTLHASTHDLQSSCPLDKSLCMRCIPVNFGQ